MTNVKIKMAKLGQIRGLGGRDPRRTYFPEELCILKIENIIFGFYIFTKMFIQCHKIIIKSLKSDALSGFGRPGVF